MRTDVRVTTESDGTVVTVTVEPGSSPGRTLRPEDTTPGWSDLPDDPNWWDLPRDEPGEPDSD